MATKGDYERALQVALDELVGNRLDGGRLVGFTWSPAMPNDDPYAPFLVRSPEGKDYELTFDVDLLELDTSRRKAKPVTSNSGPAS